MKISTQVAEEPLSPFVTVLLRYHMQQRSAAFHAADAAYPGDDI